MKLTHKLCGAALVAVAGVALAVPNTTKADVKEGKGHIGFTEDTGIQTLTDNSSSASSSGDTGSGSEITSNSTLTIDTGVGDFGIISVSPLEFKTHSVLSASQETFTADLYDNGDGNKMANFVSYTDKRAENVRDTHKLSAKLITQFQTTGGTQLNGAKITYNNVWVNDYFNAVQPSTILNNVTVELNKSSVFISNTKGTTNAGYGQHDVKFGETSGQANADQSVTLDIPKSENPSVVAGDYNGVVEWTLSETL